MRLEEKGLDNNWLNGWNFLARTGVSEDRE
jgi:hypothetical protein